MTALESMSSWNVPDTLLPRVTADNEGYWKAAAAGQLVVPHCEACGRDFYPISPRCPYCLSARIQWQPVKHAATVASWVRYRKPYFDWVKEIVPYVCAQMDIRPGVRIPMLVWPAPRRDLVIGEELPIGFVAVGKGMRLPVVQIPGGAA